MEAIFNKCEPIHDRVFLEGNWKGHKIISSSDSSIFYQLLLQILPWWGKKFTSTDIDALLISHPWSKDPWTLRWMGDCAWGSYDNDIGMAYKHYPFYPSYDVFRKIDQNHILGRMCKNENHILWFLLSRECMSKL